MLKINIQEFCSIARNKKWHKWLRSNFPKMADELEAVVYGDKPGCSKNKTAMLTIYGKITASSKLKEFEKFISKEFPAAVVGNGPKIFKNEEIINIDSPNKHGVFKSYKRHVLTFPQKLIIENANEVELKKKVEEFIKDKFRPEYVIIEDRAYIEYFLSKYKDAASDFPSDEYEIFLWRKRS